MLEFNNNHIFTGYIKQLLASFNLPSYRVYDTALHAKNQAIIAQITDYYDEYNALRLVQQQLETTAEQTGVTNPTTDLGLSLDQVKELVAQAGIPATQAQLEQALSLLQAGRTPAQVNCQIDGEYNQTVLPQDKTHVLVFSDANKAKLISVLEHDNLISTIYRDDPATYANRDKVDYPTELRYAPYIKDNKIKLYVQSADETGIYYTWCGSHAEFDNLSRHKKIHTQKDYAGYYSERYYIYNRHEINHSTTLPVTNNEYDSQTHEYLGNYLRFLRDYNKLDLMSLYNCFSNNICPELDIAIGVKHGVNNEGAEYTAKFRSDSDLYKIYMIPVKMFKTYTIALDSATDIEMFCGIYGKYYNSNSAFQALAQKTYTCFNTMQFSTPQLYTKLKTVCDWLDMSQRAALAEFEDDLKLFIKVPTSNKSSIVVLEGDYCAAGDSVYTQKQYIAKPVPDGAADRNYVQQNILTYNKTIVNFEHLEEIAASDQFKLISQPQLLRINTGTSYPFADRLIEYLTDNAITHLDEIGDNVQRTKTVIDAQLRAGGRSITVDPFWSSDLKYYIYSYMTGAKTQNTSTANRPRFAIDKTHDCLGFVDKDVEINYSSSTDTIASVDIYDNVWETE